MTAIPHRSALPLPVLESPVEAQTASSDDVYSPEDLAQLAALAEESRAIDAWIDEHRGALPTDYDEVARLPSAYRLAVLLALPPDNASALVQEHIRRCAAARPGLTDEQRAAIDQAQQLFVAAWYAGQHETRVAAWRGPFGQRIDRAFDRAEKIRIFGSIGPEDEGIRWRIAQACA